MSTFVVSPRAPPLRVRWPMGPLGQGEFLGRLGIAQRLRRLLQNASPVQRTALESGCDRLVSLDAMGQLFKVLA